MTTETDKFNKFHLKLYENETRKRKMLCGYSDGLASWNTLVYINWHIAKEKRCIECMGLAKHICSCQHWQEVHNK